MTHSHPAAPLRQKLKNLVADFSFVIGIVKDEADARFIEAAMDKAFAAVPLASTIPSEARGVEEAQAEARAWLAQTIPLLAKAAPVPMEAFQLGQQLLDHIEGRWTNYEDWCSENSTPVCIGCPDVRAIGVKLNEMGGMYCMSTIVGKVCEHAEDIDEGLAAAFQSEINYAWNGIGDWQA